MGFARIWHINHKVNEMWIATGGVGQVVPATTDANIEEIHYSSHQLEQVEEDMMRQLMEIHDSFVPVHAVVMGTDIYKMFLTRKIAEGRSTLTGIIEDDKVVVLPMHHAMPVLVPSPTAVIAEEYFKAKEAENEKSE